MLQNLSMISIVNQKFTRPRYSPSNLPLGSYEKYVSNTVDVCLTVGGANLKSEKLRALPRGGAIDEEEPGLSMVFDQYQCLE